MPTTLINPLDERQTAGASAAPRIDTLKGKTIALLDISKPGGRVFLNRIEALLRDRYEVAEVIRDAKPTFAKPAPPEVIARLRRARVQAVIEALAD
jgi:hypothetical protein